jgi:hypothetical protein
MFLAVTTRRLGFDCFESEAARMNMFIKPAPLGYRVGIDKVTTAISVLTVLIVVGSAPTVSAHQPLAINRPLEHEQQADTCRGFDFSGKITDGYFVQHGGQKIKVRIPVDYLLFPETGTSFTKASDGEANFNFHQETLRPYPRSAMQGKILVGKEEWISFLITNLSEIDAIATAYTSNYSGRKLNSGGPAYPEERVFKDLYRVQFEPTWEKKALYFGRIGSLVSDVISCDVPGPNRYPHCQQITRLSGFDVKIGYPLEELEHWQVTRRKVQDLLECMTK